MNAMIMPGDAVAALNAKARELGWTFSCHRSTEFEAPSLNAMNALWQSLAAPGMIASRNAFSARALKDFLPNLMIVDVVAGPTRNRFRYRYMGTNTTRYLGEMTGKFMDETLPPDVNERTTACYQTVVDVCRPLRFVTRFTLNAISFMSGEFFAAPLANDGVKPDMLMSVTEFRTGS